MKDLSFRENVVVITGASAGIGRELALQLSDQGAWLALAARNTGKLEVVAIQCHERGGYAASKHAMAGFFDSLRIELADTGVSVTMIYPSWVATGVRQVRPGIMSAETCARLIIRADV